MGQTRASSCQTCCVNAAGAQPTHFTRRSACQCTVPHRRLPHLHHCSKQLLLVQLKYKCRQLESAECLELLLELLPTQTFGKTHHDYQQECFGSVLSYSLEL